MEGLVGLLPLVGIVLVFWFLVIRPTQRRQRQQVEMQSALGVGDEVMLTSGIYGSVVALEDDKVRVEVAPGTVLAVARGAIGATVPAETTDPSTTDPTDGDGGSLPSTHEER